MIWNLECPVGLSQKRICAHFECRKLCAIWTVRRKGEQELRDVWEFSRPKVAHRVSNKVSVLYTISILRNAQRGGRGRIEQRYVAI